jgi:hypothetical protein
MTKTDLGLTSGIQDSTHQQNRENELIEEILRLKNEEIRLREALQLANKNVSHYQDLYLSEFDKNRNRSSKERISLTYLKIA